MFIYEKRLQYPVKIKNPDPKIAQIIISQYGGPDGELGASMRYLSQRYSVNTPKIAGVLTDIGREASEMFHFKVYRFFRSVCGEAYSGRFSADTFSTV